MTQQRTLVAGSGQPPAVPATSAGHILQLLRSNAAGYSRAELLDITGMARSTLYERLDALFAAGLVYEVTPLRSQRGRPPRALRFDDRDKLVLAVEFGHTHAGIHLLSLGRDIVASTRLPIEIGQSQEGVVGRVVNESLRLLGGRQLVGAGVGLPAPVDPLHRLGLARTVLAHWDLQRLAGGHGNKARLPILLENDACSMAVGEVRDPLESLVAVKVSTGVGSGIVVRGSLVILGRALAAIVGTLNPGRIAVGGLVGILPDFPVACARQILDDAFEPSSVDLEVVTADSMTATAVGLCSLVEDSLALEKQSLSTLVAPLARP